MAQSIEPLIFPAVAPTTHISTSEALAIFSGLVVHSRTIGVRPLNSPAFTKIVPRRRDIDLGHAETLRRSRPGAFRAGAFAPAPHHIGQVILLRLGFGQRRRGRRAKLVVGEQRLTLVVERPAVGAHVVEPYM